ncbi:unnamed protein product [Acanthoscelides obtectus]|uniref:Uncharacterized protein n=1 Tax=Acanthoscelides obtectus TaxID=200917 RepID=A0A9P0LBB6_ACAOB|nr:unnamed protein product [Acanthoscelides obtectus]CAK1626550.1 hypothetical protein AOBTE_LOCUS3921 [Acanthoscelides obtectus]
MMKNQTFTDMLPGRKLRDFVDTFHENQGTYIKALLKHIQTISFFCDEISEDYAQIEDLDLSKQTADNDLQYYLYVNNLQILLHSKVLSYVGVTLGSKYTKLSKDTVEVFLNKRIPRIIELILRNYNETKKAFDRLKRSAMYYAEYKERPRSENKYLHSKLKSALTDAVNNISILLDKSQIILDRLGDGAINALEDSMKDLRAHSLATHESIDLLCRLHGIVTNAQPASDAEPPKHLTVNKTYEERICGNIRYDDIVQPEEGRYMIYVDKDPEEEISRTARNDVDETVGAFCRLTLEELRRSLMQNGTFMEARKRRFSNESSEEFNADSPPKPELSPRFDLETTDVHEEPEAKSSSVNNEDVYSGKPPVPLPRSAMKATRYLDQFFMKDMPPPPPMPTFNLGRGYEEHGGYGNKSMLEEIMTLSKQRDVKEEVFVVSDRF